MGAQSWSATLGHNLHCRTSPRVCRGAGANVGAKHEAKSSHSATSSRESDKDLDTAFVQEMLATDPVVALGMRVASAGLASPTLEYISIDEARADFSALQWFHDSTSCRHWQDRCALFTAP